MFNMAFGQNTIKLGKLEISKNDLSAPGYSIPTRFELDDITFYLEEHPEWRLPTLDELVLMYENRELLGMNGEFYMAKDVKRGYTISSTYANESWYKNPYGREFYLNFYNRGKILTICTSATYVRLVKVE